mmetsp:Transcript_5141/g.4631  ORF Transcript_5141/g.4631 Transcript_5141/m.4631 type:complete len:986 (-) Transcript_5141:43-3000(-)
MPLRLEISKQLTARSDRVKSVDIFPAEHPWVLSALFNGKVFIWDYQTNNLVKSFDLCEVPVRCAKFIVRKQWIIAGTDDMQLRVYNYNTQEKIKEWEAHHDYIRYIEVHPNRPYILSSSDDMSIKLWDWDKDFELIQTFEGHVHYVMMVKVNPRDTNTFASASLDRSIKVWGLTSNTAHFSLEGAGSHEKGVNCIDYYPGGDKPYILSGADDRTVKIWDYQTKACLQTLEGHSHNVSCVCFHPRLPLIISASEDGTVRLWHSTTYRPETTLNYGLERAWTLAPTKDASKLAIGYDEGTVVLKLGNEKPVASMDSNTSKLIWAQGHDIQTMSLKGLNKDNDLQDGEKVTLSARDLGSCEVYPQVLQHNNNGSFIVVCGDGEYIIYTSQALRNKAFGSALDFVWSALGTGDYAIRESISRVRTFKNFKDHKQITLPMSSADTIFGGHCLGVKGGESIAFFDWESGEFIRKIDVIPTAVYWNDSGDMVVLVCKDIYYILQYSKEVVTNAIVNGNINPEEGIEGSFELENSISDKIRTGQWVGDCFLYTNTTGKLNYYIGGEVMTLCHLNYPMYLLGYIAKEDRIYLIDKAYNVISYKLLVSVLNYQTCVVRKDFLLANQILPSIPKSEYNAIARFLESQGFKEEALNVTLDPDHKFELAIDLRKIDIAHDILINENKKYSNTVDENNYSIESNNRWRRLGDLALFSGNIELAKTCALLSNDLSGLLLLYTSSGDKDGMIKLANDATTTGRFNVAFLAYFITGQVEKCVQLLIDSGRIPEAAFFARTYVPSMISSVLQVWKADLKQINEKAAEALADPIKYPNLFPDLDWAIKVESIFKSARDTYVPANSYPTAKSDLELNLIEIVKAQAAAGVNLDNVVKQVDPIEDIKNETIEVVDDIIEEPIVKTPVVTAPSTPIKSIDVGLTSSSIKDTPKPEPELKDIEDDIDDLIEGTDELEIEDGFINESNNNVNNNKKLDDDFLLDDENDW